jgi:hypothetical protein
MPVNLDKPQKWKADIARSVDFYNSWFMHFAPKAFRETRIKTTKQVEEALKRTNNLIDIKPEVLERYPNILPILRMSTCPPIARDRLIGLAGVSNNLVNVMELKGKTPPKMKKDAIYENLKKIINIIKEMADVDIFTWLMNQHHPHVDEIYRASTIVADRLCGAVADPIIRNAQEQRQLASIANWLKERGYEQIMTGEGISFDSIKPGTFSFRMIVPANQKGKNKQVNIPVDAVIKPKSSVPEDYPILFEAKSAGDFTNTNKRRKEEAVKMMQLMSTYGENIKFVLFLCGYFDSGYLGYEAAEGIDWVWEHRIDELKEFGL